MIGTTIHPALPETARFLPPVKKKKVTLNNTHIQLSQFE